MIPSQLDHVLWNPEGLLCVVKANTQIDGSCAEKTGKIQVNHFRMLAAYGDAPRVHRPEFGVLRASRVRCDGCFAKGVLKCIEIALGGTPNGIIRKLNVRARCKGVWITGSVRRHGRDGRCRSAVAS